MLRILLIVFALVASGRYADGATTMPRINCTNPYARDLDLAPIGSGPLQLAAVYCQIVGFAQFSRSAAVISPDGLSIAYVENKSVLRVAWLGGATWSEYKAEMTFDKFGSSFRSPSSFGWASDSRGVWIASQERLYPSGFAKTPLQPLLALRNGLSQTLPTLRHSAGSLDALLWASGDGFAIAQFGSKGGYYRPPRDDAAPLVAMVDAFRGHVLEILSFADIEKLRAQTPDVRRPLHIRDAAAIKRPDGKLRALLSVGEWIVWTQGEPPRAIADPYATESHNRMTIAPDGSTVLIGRLLRTRGGICGGGQRVGGCRPGDPVEGTLAALHSLETGQLLWSVSARVANNHEYPQPAISPDGRYALVGLVPEEARIPVALVSMSDGRIVQTFPAPGSEYSMGFARGGSMVWANAGGITAVYNVQRN